MDSGNHSLLFRTMDSDNHALLFRTMDSGSHSQLFRTMDSPSHLKAAAAGAGWHSEQVLLISFIRSRIKGPVCSVCRLPFSSALPGPGGSLCWFLSPPELSALAPSAKLADLSVTQRWLVRLESQLLFWCSWGLVVFFSLSLLRLLTSLVISVPL